MPGRNGGTLMRGGSAGRPKGTVSLRTLVQNVLAEEVDGVTRAEKMVREIVELAGKGRASCIKFLKDYAEGAGLAETIEDIFTPEEIANAFFTEYSVKPAPPKSPSPAAQSLFRKGKRKR